jgi:hypothetical protein
VSNGAPALALHVQRAPPRQWYEWTWCSLECGGRRGAPAW